MAIYHLNLSHGSIKGGQSARAKLDYISREGKYEKREDVCRLVESHNLPNWASDAQHFWRATDKNERANARLFSEFEFSLPVELPVAKQLELVREFAQTQIPQQPYTFAIHEGKGTNPHCHLIYSERSNDGIERNEKTHFKRANSKSPDLGGAKKNRELKSKSFLVSTREAWATIANKYLDTHKKFGKAPRIDHRTLKAQGISRTPEKHIGHETLAEAKRKLLKNRSDSHGRDTNRQAERSLQRRGTGESIERDSYRIAREISATRSLLRKASDSGKEKTQRRAESLARKHDKRNESVSEQYEIRDQLLHQKYERENRFESSRLDERLRCYKERIESERKAAEYELRELRDKADRSQRRALTEVGKMDRELDGRREAALRRIRKSSTITFEATQSARRNFEFFKGITRSTTGRKLIERRGERNGIIGRIKGLSRRLAQLGQKIRQGYEVFNAALSQPKNKNLAELIARRIKPIKKSLINKTVLISPESHSWHQNPLPCIERVVCPDLPRVAELKPSVGLKFDSTKLKPVIVKKASVERKIDHEEQQAQERGLGF
ncbi:MAG: MobA/MobL family protein [Lentisphaeraceae bacterium]|nr:MobA/MobL family protein [Lentisphaeraceae bacterium]